MCTQIFDWTIHLGDRVDRAQNFEHTEIISFCHFVIFSFFVIMYHFNQPQRNDELLTVNIKLNISLWWIELFNHLNWSQ